MKTKKNLLIVSIAALVMALALAGCGSSGASSSSSSASDSTTSASSSAATTQSTTEVKWTEAKTAEEAAKAAGVEELTVPKAGTKISLGELGEWKYYSADKMAEADGGAAAAEIVIRKAVGSDDNTAGSGAVTGTGRDLRGVTYAADWNKEMDGTNVHCYGKEKGTVSKAIWTDGKYSYSILVLGQGDNWQEFGIPEDDITILVKGAKKASTDESSASSQSAQANSAEYDELVNNAVFENGLGELVSYKATTDADGNQVFEIVTRGADGKEYSSVLDADGNVLENGYAQANPDSAVDTDDELGTNETTGDPDIENAVWENGLGEYVSSQTVWDVDGNTYQEVVTRGADGEEYVTYFDDNYNIVDDIELNG